MATQHPGFDDAVRAALAANVERLTDERDAWQEITRKAVRIVEKVITEQTFYGDTARAISDLFDAFDRMSDGEVVGAAARRKIDHSKVEAVERYTIQYGQFHGEKGYVVIDTVAEPNYLGAGRKFLLTTHNRGEAEQFVADRVSR